MTDRTAPASDSTPSGGGDALLVEGYVVKGGLVFRLRASGDLAAVVKKASGDLVELPVRVIVNAAGEMIVSGIKAGLQQVTADQFRRMLPRPAKEKAK